MSSGGRGLELVERALEAGELLEPVAAHQVGAGGEGLAHLDEAGAEARQGVENAPGQALLGGGLGAAGLQGQHHGEAAEAPDHRQHLRDWPRVEIVQSHAGASGEVVRALLKPVDATPPVRGLVISATGNGSIHHAIHQVLEEAVSEGLLARRDILVATRCIGGWVVGDPPQGWPVAAELTPAQARVALMLEMASR